MTATIKAQGAEPLAPVDAAISVRVVDDLAFFHVTHH